MWRSCEQGLAAVEKFALRKAACRHSWLRHLASAAQRFVESNGPERSSCRRLLGVGQRKSTLFGQFDNAIPVFGLTDASLMSILRLESRVQYLRDIARKICEERDVLVIKICIYMPGTESKEIRTLQIATVNISKIATQYLPKRWTYERKPTGAQSKHNGGVRPDIKYLEEHYSINKDSIVFLRDDGRFRWVDPPTVMKNPEAVRIGAE